MENKIWAIVVIVLILVVTTLTEKIIGSRKINELIDCLNNKEFARYYELLNSKIVRLTIDTFNREYMCLNGAILQGNKKLVEQQIELINKRVKMNKKQQIDFYNKAFIYYVDMKDKEKAELFKDKINSVGVYFEPSNADLIYNIKIEKGYKYLDDLLKCVDDEDANEERKKMQFALIAQMYENKNDKVNAKKFDDMAKLKGR